MDSADTPRPHHELARLTELPPALRASLPPAAATRPAGGSLAISPRLVLRGLARHWWQAMALWIVGTAALAALVYLRYEPSYRSFSLLRIEPNATNPYVKTNDTSDPSFLNTQIQLITSPNVLATVKTDPKVAAVPGVRSSLDAEAYLRELIQVKPRPGSNLIEISAETQNNQDAAVIVNAVVDAFLEADKEWSAARTSASTRLLKDHADELAARINDQQAALFDLTREAEDPGMILRNLDSVSGGGGDSGDSEQDPQFVVGVGEYQGLYKKLLDIEFEEIGARTELEMARRQAAAIDPRVWVERRIEQVFLGDEEVRGLREALRDLDVRFETARRTIKNPGDPALSRLQGERQRMLERYNQLWADLEPSLRARLAEEPDNPTQIVRQAEAKLIALENHRAMVQEQLDRIDLDDRSRGIDALKMSFAASKLSQLRGMESKVQQKLEALQFTALGADPITVIAPARASNMPEAGKRDKFLALTPLAMLGLVLGLVTLVELRSGRVSSADDLTGRISAAIFAVPPLPTARSNTRGRLEGPGADPKFEQFVQQLDHLRVALCGEGGHDGRGRCVLITSAVGGEGKTTLAAQLAVRCAEAGASTVLVDADLRRSTLGRLFEVPDCPGLSDVLRGDATLEDALVPISQVGGCQLLPAGSPEPNPNRILRSTSFAPMLERLRRSFDVVIIDTSPVLPVPDALILGRLADGAVIATRHDQSRFPAVERANGLLAGAGIPVLGVVVNGARASDRSFGGSAGYAAYTYRSDRVPDSST